MNRPRRPADRAGTTRGLVNHRRVGGRLTGPRPTPLLRSRCFAGPGSRPRRDVPRATAGQQGPTGPTCLLRAVGRELELHVHHSFDGPDQPRRHGDEGGVPDPADELHHSLPDVDAQRGGGRWEEVGDDLAPYLLGDLLVTAQEDLEQVGAADHALEHTELVHHGEPLDLGPCHGACGLGERGVRAGGESRRRHQLFRRQRVGLRQVGESAQLRVPVGGAVAELLLVQEVRLGDDADEHSPSTTGRALTCQSRISFTSSLKDACRPTLTTVCVMTSLTMCGVPCMVTPLRQTLVPAPYGAYRSSSRVRAARRRWASTWPTHWLTALPSAGSSWHMERMPTASNS